MLRPPSTQKIYRRDSMGTFAGIFAIMKLQTGTHSGTGSLCRVVHQSLELQERGFGEALTRFSFAAGSPCAAAFSSDLDTKMEAATGCGLLFLGILCLLCTHFHSPTSTKPMPLPSMHRPRIERAVPQANSWSQLSPSGGPPQARGDHAMVWASASNGFYVFGGENEEGPEPQCEALNGALHA